MPESVFLTADWHNLALVNYEVEPDVLTPYVPAGTEIDLWEGRCYVSVVGLRFLKTKLLGVPMPFHRDFPEVNLRFYVRREVDGELRRGVVFIKEIVPLHAVTWVARGIYNENYVTLPMREEIAADSFLYEWRFKGDWCRLEVKTRGDWSVPRSRLRGVIRCGALLGLCRSARRLDPGVRSRAPAMAYGEGRRGEVRVRCCESLRRGIRGRVKPGAGVGVHGGGVGGSRAARSAVVECAKASCSARKHPSRGHGLESIHLRNMHKLKVLPSICATELSTKLISTLPCRFQLLNRDPSISQRIHSDSAPPEKGHT